MSAKFLIVLLLSLSLISPCYAAGLARIPTQEQIDKYCVGVWLTIDRDIHYFAYSSIKSFTQEGLTIIYGKNKEKENFIPRENILNFQQAYDRYVKLVLEFARIR